MSKLRILCLHGYMQNASVLRNRTAVLRKALKDIAEFDYITAPHYVDSYILKPEQTDEGQRAWWNAKNDPPQYIGFQTSMDLITQTFQTKGPYHGVLGFSQGAAMASMVAMHLSSFLNFVILVSGFVPRDPTLFPSATSKTKITPSPSSSSSTKCNLPSLHIMGTQDTWVSLDQSEKLTQLFQAPEIYVHSGGHYLPMDEKGVQVIRQFLNQHLHNGVKL